MLKSLSTKRPQSLEDLLPGELIARLDPLDLQSRKVFFGKLKGERRSKKRGESVEFADHRPYVMGDDIRHIDWNIFGRLDKLFLKLFLEEEDLSLHLVIDASASSDCGDPNKFLFMQKAAMALGYVGLVNLNRVGATSMGGWTGGREESDGEENGVQPSLAVGATIRDLRGRRRVHDLSRWVCSLRPGGALSFRAAAERITLTRRGKGIMLVFSDFFFKEGYEQGLRMLVGGGYDVFCVQVLSPQEVDPAGGGRGGKPGDGIAGDLRLKDIEDGDTADVTISAPLLKRYKSNLAAYCDQLREFCLRRDMQLLTVRSDTPIETLVLDYLRKRGIVR
ncbi:MAG: DUF58 domain-containing protein [Phycisphaerales bacterium]